MTTPQDLAAAVLEAGRRAGMRIATAESCTGGLIAACLTGIAGSSDVFERGFITYSNESKTEILGVPAVEIAEHGAVSSTVARAMAAGALARSYADVAVAVTGIAGPGGGSADKPVGLVHIVAMRRDGRQSAERHVFAGDRAAVRQKTVAAALAMLLRLLGA